MGLTKFCLALLTAYLVLVCLAWLFQRRLIYLPMGGVPPPAGEVFPGGEDVTLHTEDGLRLGAWYFPAADGTPRATVILCNGNAGNRGDRALLGAALARHGIAVLLMDYRGYGGNPGTPSEPGLIADLRAARHYMETVRGAAAERQVLFGESLGAAVALASAVEDSPAGLVLRSPFLSLAAVGRLHYPFLPVGALLRDRYPSLVRVGGVRCPLLVLVGGRDQIVPAVHSRELYDAAPVTDKRFVSYPEDDHNSRQFLDDPVMVEEVAGFVLRVAETP